MTPTWTDVAQAIGSLGTFLIATVGFIVLIFQIRQLERAIQGDTHSKLYEHGIEPMQLIFEHPELWPYVFGGKRLAEDDPLHHQVDTLIRIIAAFIEHVTLQRPNLPSETRERWVACIQDVYISSPLLREHLSANAHWYGKRVSALCREFDRHVNMPPTVLEPTPTTP